MPVTRVGRIPLATRRARIEELRAPEPPATVAVTWERAWSRGLWGSFLPERRRARDDTPAAARRRDDDDAG